MRNILLMLGWVLLCASLALGQAPAPGPAASVEISRVHCLVRFVETLAGNNYVGSRRVFEQSRFNTPAAQRWLRRHRLPAGRSFVLSTTGPADPLVLVCAHGSAQLAQAATLLARKGRLDPARPFTELQEP